MRQWDTVAKGEKCVIFVLLAAILDLLWSPLTIWVFKVDNYKQQNISGIYNNMVL